MEKTWVKEKEYNIILIFLYNKNYLIKNHVSKAQWNKTWAKKKKSTT